MTTDGAISVDRARALIAATTAGWVNDPSSDVVWAGEHEGRLGIRMAQQVRDFTTVWFEIGQRTVGFEALLLPAPRDAPAAFLRHCLIRNRRAWPATIALDRDGDLYVQGRIPLERLNPTSLDTAVGAVYETVELSFRPLLDLARHGREKSP